MKTIKSTLLFAFILCLTPNFSQAQKMYQVHRDNVKPSMIMEYEKICKEFNTACVEHNVQTSWITATTSNLNYMYVSPIENYADLDQRPFADMAKAMGDDFKNLFERFDKCYDTHGTYILTLSENLSYMPDGISQTQEGQNYRDYYFLYFTPDNEDKLKEGMKAVKAMFTEKGSKSYYRVYRSGFGVMDSYYMVAMSSKDEIDSANKHIANNELLGPERHETFQKVMNYASKVEDVTGEIRPDLAYSPK
jgi:hypothetical protein